MWPGALTASKALTLAAYRISIDWCVLLKPSQYLDHPLTGVFLAFLKATGRSFLSPTRRTLLP